MAPQRDRLDAVVVFPSMPEVMRLNKVGSFTMANLGQSKSIVADFMKSKKKQDGSSFEEGMLKLLRTLPKVLKYLPGDKAADAKSFMMSFQYWLGGSPGEPQAPPHPPVHRSCVTSCAPLEVRLALACTPAP